MIGCFPSMLVSRPFLAFALVFAVIGYSHEAHAQSCPEFQKRVAERTVGEHQGTRDLIVTADFDGNGKPDRAFFVTNDDKTSLFICLHGQARAFEAARVHSIASVGIRLADPGVYDSACAKGIGPDCRPGEKLRLEVDGPAIHLFHYESSASIIYWEGDRFERFWLS
ncbi:MAG: hypothetical protein OXH94_12075 [Rhodospirillales bacterium]|nr:hypothetical protein [Rhodospirillales bacterium]